MRMRTLAAVGFALLLTLSGCSALPGGGGGDDGLGSVSYPDGAGEDGFSNATAVLAGHQDSLAEESYRVAYNVTHARPGEVTNTTTVVASNEDEGRQRLVADLAGRQVEQFADADRAYSRVQAQGESAVDSQAHGLSMAQVHRSGARPGGMLRTIVSAGDYEANRTDTVRGHEVVWYEATAARDDATGQLPQEIGEFEASVAIDEEGRIWEGNLFAVGQSNGTEVIFRQEYRTMAAGDVSVTRPDWVDDAA